MSDTADPRAVKLLAIAEDDLRAAGATARAGDVRDDVVGFHGQQAVEKAYKALLHVHDTAYRFSHDIGYLAELLRSVGVAPTSSLDDAERLSPYAGGFRYDLGHEVGPPPDVAIAIAASAVAWAREQIDAAP